MNDLKGRPPRGGVTGLNLPNRHHPNPRLLGQPLLGPIEEAAGGPALCRRDHGGLLPRFWWFSPNTMKFDEYPLTLGNACISIFYQCLHCFSTLNGVTAWSSNLLQLPIVAVRDRIRAHDPHIDEQTLADTVEGLTDLHEIVTAIIRSALADEALATGLKSRIAEMQERLDRLQDRASKRRQIAKDVMVDLDIKKITAPDFTVSIRPGMPSLLVLDEAAVPSIYWQPVAPRLNRQELLSELKEGADIEGVTLSNTEPVLSVRTK